MSMELDAFQAEVADRLNERGLTAEIFHSGGGIWGVRVELGNSELFSTCAADSEYDWTGWDLSGSDGEYIAHIKGEARPHGSKYRGTNPPNPITVADDLVRILDTLRGTK